MDSLKGGGLLTAGPGGMGCAQPLAASLAGMSSLNIECRQTSIDFRLKTRYVDEQASDLDVELPDDTGDEAYLAALDQALDTVFTRARPELVIYLAGADPYAGDRLGRLALSIEGLQARDERVLGACRAAGVPVAVAMAGGYAQPIEDTVTVHFNTICTAARLMGTH